MYPGKKVKAIKLVQLYIFNMIICFLLISNHVFANKLQQSTNSIGIDLVQVPAGSFEMGSTEGDWDEVPVHNVTISDSFYISKTEITLEQYKNFKPDYQQQSDNGMVTAVSWYDAVEFCEWLSNEEGVTYRLPTEAEWEYACTWSGDSTLLGMRDNVPEWCSDWYGFYKAEAQVDPVGPVTPDVAKLKVVRGGKVDDDSKIYLINDLEPDIDAAYYHRSNNRVSLPPAFGLPNIENGNFGKHIIGFRIVQGDLPETNAYDSELTFIAQGLKQSNSGLNQAPPAGEPYFRKRFLLPRPPDNKNRADVIAAGFHESLQWHNHSPALSSTPNGDLLVIFFSAPQWNKEQSPNVPLIAARLRYGADQWDFPELFLDCADTKEASPLLWKEQDGTMYLFWGHNAIDVDGNVLNPKYGSYPFQWMTSTNNGATWSDIRYPVITGAVGDYNNQPVNSAFRDNEGAIYISSDAHEGTSLLWKSDDNGQTWSDTGGRTKGRHTTFCLLDDGTILGMGGKEAGIDGFLAKSVSGNKGSSYTYSKSPFPQIGGNQRPSVLKLKSGRIFFASDWQTIWGTNNTGNGKRGSFVALSDDNGQTWTTKDISVALPHEQLGPRNFTILGYSAATQSVNGMIHLITTMNTPCLHFEFNEAWILDPDADKNSKDEDVMPNPTNSVSAVSSYTEKYQNNQTKISWNAGIGDDGRYLLHGPEQWFYEDGTKQYEAMYAKGEKIGAEVFYRPDGSKVWEWTQNNNGSKTWIQYWENGNKKAESNWYNSQISGTAYTWDRSGNLLTTKTWPILTSLPDDKSYHPDQFRLYQNFPNPFNPITHISYSLPFSAEVRLDVFDILGRHIQTLVNRSEQEGVYSVKWNGTDKYNNKVSSGIYFYRLDAKSASKNFTKQHKMLLLK